MPPGLIPGGIIVTISQSPRPMSADFTQTNWTLILQAADHQSPGGREALEHLCRRYWNPLNAYVRGFGRSHHDAEDTTQAFFQHLLELRLFDRADRDRGRFRTFLMTSLRNFMIRQHRDATVQKRGGGVAEHVSLDVAGADFEASLVLTESPDLAFDRKWALTVLEQSMASLEAEQGAAGSGERFAVLKPLVLDHDRGAAGELDTAQRLGLSEAGVRTALSRLRARYRELVRAEVARLVDDPAEVDDEIAHLMRALS